MPDPMFLPMPREQLSQGDVFEGIEISDLAGNPPTFSARILLLTNDCDIDKVKTHPVVLGLRVTPMSVLENADRGLAGDVRRDRVPAAMLLESCPAFHESFLDFRYVHRVSREDLLSALQKGRRLASMSEDGRMAVLARFYAYFARRQQPRAERDRAPTVVGIPPPAGR